MTATSVAVQEQRRAVTEAKLADTGYDLSMLTETQFEDGLRRVTLVQERIQKLIGTTLQDGLHYGNPNKAFKRKILYKSGAQEMRRVMRLTLRTIDKQVTDEDGYVAVIVEVQAIDSMGRVVAQSSGACNSREKRFRKHGSKDQWTYADARETLHDCLSMAEKRAGVAVTLEASGATAFFADADALDAIEEAEYEQREEWSQDQKRAFMLAAKDRGMAPGEQMKAFVMDRCEGRSVPFADEATDLIEAVLRWQAPKSVDGEVAVAKEPPPAAASRFEEDGEGA